MYISRLILPLADRRTQRLLSDAYYRHQLVMDAFKGAPGCRVLHRIEPETGNGMSVWLVQSEVEPNFDSENIPARIDPPKSFEPTFLVGRRYQFRLRANPIVKRDGKRRAVLKDAEMQAWLARKLEVAGARVLGVQVIPEGSVYGFKPTANGRQRLLFNSARFEGVLEVTDGERLAEALREGIGPAKAFGFGLLSLARIS